MNVFPSAKFKEKKLISQSSSPIPIFQRISEFEIRVNLVVRVSGLWWILRKNNSGMILGTAIENNKVQETEQAINPFSTNDLLLYPLKTSENHMFSDVFRGYRGWTLVENGLNNGNLKDVIVDSVKLIFHKLALFS